MNQGLREILNFTLLRFNLDKNYSQSEPLPWINWWSWLWLQYYLHSMHPVEQPTRSQPSGLLCCCQSYVSPSQPCQTCWDARLFWLFKRSGMQDLTDGRHTNDRIFSRISCYHSGKLNSMFTVVSGANTCSRTWPRSVVSVRRWRLWIAPSSTWGTFCPDRHHVPSSKDGPALRSTWSFDPGLTWGVPGSVFSHRVIFRPKRPDEIGNCLGRFAERSCGLYVHKRVDTRRAPCIKWHPSSNCRLVHRRVCIW